MKGIEKEGREKEVQEEQRMENEEWWKEQRNYRPHSPFFSIYMYFSHLLFSFLLFHTHSVSHLPLSRAHTLDFNPPQPVDYLSSFPLLPITSYCARTLRYNLCCPLHLYYETHFLSCSNVDITSVSCLCF